MSNGFGLFDHNGDDDGDHINTHTFFITCKPACTVFRCFVWLPNWPTVINDEAEMSLRRAKNALCAPNIMGKQSRLFCFFCPHVCVMRKNPENGHRRIIQRMTIDRHRVRGDALCFTHSVMWAGLRQYATRASPWRQLLLCRRNGYGGGCKISFVDGSW